MAWTFYGFMHPSDHSQYGPLARKRWIPSADDPKHRMNYKSPRQVTNIRRGEGDQYNGTKATAYARWLAARDGIKLPDTPTIRVDWAAVYGEHRKRGQNRVKSVSWGRNEQVYNTRKDGRRGAYLYTQFVAELTIEIPNWDFDPAEPVEEFETAELLAA